MARPIVVALDVNETLTDLRPLASRLKACGAPGHTNGAANSARAVLEAGGVTGHLEAILSIDEVKRWKPAPEVYRFAAERCGVAPAAMMLAAVHPWDIDGARRAGLRAAWINRGSVPYPPVMTAADVEARDFFDLAEQLSALK